MADRNAIMMISCRTCVKTDPLAVLRHPFGHIESVVRRMIRNSPNSPNLSSTVFFSVAFASCARISDRSVCRIAIRATL